MITNDDKIQSSLVYSVNRNEKHQSTYIDIYIYIGKRNKQF